MKFSLHFEFFLTIFQTHDVLGNHFHFLRVEDRSHRLASEEYLFPLLVDYNSVRVVFKNRFVKKSMR